MKPNQSHLAWHETMELHELVASQSAQLVGFKNKLSHVQDASLRELYKEAIHSLEHNLRELLKFYPMAPTMDRSHNPDMTAFDAGSLLGFTKSAIKSYAAAITETATPQLREIFQKHLLNAIALHAKVFNFMYSHDFYPAYNLEKMLATDVKNANVALQMPSR